MTAEQQPQSPESIEGWQPDIVAARDKVTSFEREARAFIQQRPVVAVLAAAGVGYLIARLVAWRPR